MSAKSPRKKRSDQRKKKERARVARSARRSALSRRRVVIGIGLCLLIGGIIAVSTYRPEEAPSPPRRPAAETSRTAPPAMPPALAVRFQRAWNLIGAGRSVEAMPILQAIAREMRQMSLPPAVLSVVNFNLCVALQRADKPDDALGMALQWLETHTDDLPHNLIAGTLLYDRLRYGDAAPRLKTGLRADPEEIRQVSPDPLRIFCQLADCYIHLQRTDDARRIIDAVLAQDPDHAVARRIMASLAARSMDYPRALKLLEELYQADPKDTLVTQQLANIALEAGRPQRTVEVIRAHWAAGGTRSPYLRLVEAKALIAAGQPRKAILAAAAVLVLDPSYDNAYFVIADAYARAGKPELARPFRDRYARTAQLRTELERAHTAANLGYPFSAAYYRGRALAGAGRFGPALKELKKARRLAPDNGQVVGELATLLIQTDRPFDAHDLLTQFETAAGGNRLDLPAEFYLAKARLALRMGDPGACFDAIERAVAAGRCERTIAEVAARAALLTKNPRVLGPALKSFSEKAALDADAGTWFGARLLLEGKAQQALDRLTQARQTTQEPKPLLLLALGLTHRALRNRTEAAEAFRKLLATETLLRAGWKGLAESSDRPEEVAKARAWLLETQDTEERLLEEGRLLAQARDSAPATELLLRVARLRHGQGMHRRARGLTRLARDVDPLIPAVHRQVLQLFTRPEDTFERLHALEALARLTPADEAVEVLRRQEYQRLQLGSTEDRARQKQ